MGTPSFFGPSSASHRRGGSRRGRAGRLFRALGCSLLVAVFAPAAAAVPPIIFVSRGFEKVPSSSRTAAVERALDGKLLVREPSGAIRVLADASDPAAPALTPLDVSDPAVSYEGDRVVFSGYSREEGAWRIYEVRADGSGLRHVTRGDRTFDSAPHGEVAAQLEGHDDLDPCYLPDGRICFVSTRYPGLAPGGRLRATNLYLVNADGSGLRRLTTERFGADTPAVDPATGRIVYSRWWISAQPVPPPTGGPSPDRPPAYYGPVVSANNFSPTVLRGIPDHDFPGVNNWSLASIHPDGTGLDLFAGFGLHRELTMAYRPSFLPSGEVLALFIRESPFLGFPGRHGLRRSAPGAVLPAALGGPQTLQGSATIADPNPAVAVRSTTANFFYSSAEPLPDGRLLITGFPRSGSNLPPATQLQDHDIFIQEPRPSAPVKLYGEANRMELDAVPLAARPPPPVLAPALESPAEPAAVPRTVEEAFEMNGSFTFLVENIFFNAPVDVPVANAPPVGRELVIEFYMNPQRSGPLSRPDPPLLVGRRPIDLSGRIEMELPAGVPLFEVLRRPDGQIALGRDGQAFHVGGMNFGAAGSVARCVGCHAGHSGMEVPEDSAWTNLAPSAVVFATSTFTPQTGARVPLSPALLVDRRTDLLASEWAAGNVPLSGDPTRVSLRWRQPIRAREAVVYGVRHAGTQVRAADLTVTAFTLRTYLGDERREEIIVARPVEPAGSRVALDPSLPFDRIEVSIRPQDVTGTYMGSRGPALAEIEVIAQVVPALRGTITLVRGDVSCDGLTNITDALLMLNRLFKAASLPGAGTLCCEAAGDVNADEVFSISDPIHLLNWLYRGGPPAAEPTSCGRVPAGALACDQEVCP
jgi:hypothetical protein